MANIIDIFNASKLEVSKLTGSNGLFQSEREIVEQQNSQNKFISNVDYSEPSNFARFGSAEEYYKNAINYIISEYPVDGSRADKLKWENSLNEFEYYLYKNEYPKAVGHVAISSSASQYIQISKSLRDNTLSAKTAYNELNSNVNSTYLDLSDSITYEVWAKLGASGAYTSLLSASNGSRTFEFQLYFDGTTNYIYSKIDGTTVSNYFDSSTNTLAWNRYSFVLSNTSSKVFINGNLVKETTFSTSSFSGSFEFKAKPVNNNRLYLDDMRLWNSERSEEKIGKFWFLPVDGNDITDDSMIFNLKFNEGIDTTSQYASTCIDYSGRQNDAVIAGYVPNVRASTSAFDESGLLDDLEEKDPITIGRSLSSTLSTFYTTKVEAGQEYDYENDNALYKKFPSWILEAEEEQETKHLKQIIQIVSSYFDDLYNKISEVNKYKTQQFQTDSDKIYPFYDKILSSTGFDFTDLFSSLSSAEQISSRTDDNIFNQDVQKVKNSIYQNIYNNLAYILKSKGTEKSIQSFLRSYGIDDNLIRVNLYGNDYEYKLLDTSKSTTIKKKVIDFEAYQTASVYLSSSLVESPDQFSSFTLEGAFQLPSSSAETGAGVKYSLFGFHTPNDVSNLTWDTGESDFSCYIEKDSSDVSKSKFILSSSFFATTLTSSQLYDVYDNSVWNISVRVSPTKQSDVYPIASTDYLLEFYGVSHKADAVDREFYVTGTLNNANIVESSKSFYIGAHRTNFSGSVLQQSNVKALYLNYWDALLDDESIKFHNKDLMNYGTSFPTKKTSVTVGDYFDFNSSLKLSWNFDSVTGSDSNGKFEVLDTADEKYGKGIGFPVSTNSFIYKEYLQTNKQMLPETLNGTDTIYVLSEDDQEFNKLTKRPQSLKLYVENSMYQIISDEMLNVFGTITSFNNLIGEGQYKYSGEYNELNILRRQFFKKIQNKPSIEKYMEFYKWLDSSLGFMLDQLKPENSYASKGLKTTIESHVLERNKYKHILPTSFVNAKIHTASVSVAPSTVSSSKEQGLTDTISDIVTVTNTSGVNFSANYEIVQTAGKLINDRSGKTNKTVIQTNFSAGDGLSEANRDTSGEVSIYNSLLNRNQDVRIEFNQSVASDTNSNSDDYVTNNNGFVSRNIPASASNFYTQRLYATLTGNINYETIPSARILDQRLNNTILSVKQPAIQHMPSMKHTGRVNGALSDIEIESPYSSKFTRFSSDDLVKASATTNLTDEDTFYRRVRAITGSFQTKRVEYLEQLYPKKDIEGLAETRTKPNFEEVAGTGSNGYDRNSGQIRMFWRDGIDNRLRTRGVDTASYTGSVNCMNYPNYSASTISSINKVVVSGSAATTCSYQYTNNLYNSLYSLDNKISINLQQRDLINDVYVGYSNLKVGDLSAFQTPERVKTILSQSTIITNNTSSIYTSYDKRVQPKPTFIFTNYPSYSYTSASAGLTASVRQNLSYTSNNTDITPAYNSYVEYFTNIKHKSQNYSILPEFMVSNHESIIVGTDNNAYSYTGSGGSEYLKILGREQFSQITASNFVTDKIKVIDRDSNKLKIKVKGIKKLLPYNGFYPQQRAVQIVDLFQKSYINVSQSQITGSHYVDNTTKTPLDQQIQTLIQPLFAPGVLFNSIKSGIAVDFPVYATSSAAVYTTKPNFYNSCSANDVDSRFYILDSASTHKVQFEALLDPRSLLAKSESNADQNSGYMYYLDPTHYSTALVSGSSVAYPIITMSDGSRNWNFDSKGEPDTRYKYAINNYLAEIVKFFLRRGELTSFQSGEFSTISVPAIGEYKMDISISRNNNFSMFKSYGDQEAIVPEGSLFGPPMRFWSGSITDAPYAHTAAIKDPAYAAYAPPYLLGETKTIITFNATQTGSYSFNQIISNLTFSTSNPEIDKIFSSSAGSLLGTGNYNTSPAYERKMDLTPCMNFKQLIPTKTITRDSNGRITLESIENQNKKWVIETKFESPLIDYSDFSINFQVLDSVTNPAGSADVVKVFNSNYGLDGIWNTKGEIPKDKQSVQLRLNDAGYEKSLASLLNFRPDTKSIGVLADAKEISEAIVLVPKLNINIVGRTNKINIPVNKINKILNIPDYKQLDILTIKERLESDSSLDENNSIVKLMRAMVKYNVPPHLNWLSNKTITPFVMYIAEFTHALTKQDLANIWQGDLPEIGKTPEEDEVIIEHDLNQDELLSDIDSDLIYFEVFKVKLRGETDYYNITSGQEQQQQEIPYYSYNWPYDFFSLVELVNIEAGLVKEVKPSQQLTLTTLSSGGTIQLDQQGVKDNLVALISSSIS